MASGIRLAHPVHKSCTLIIEHFKPYTAPLLCGPCGKTHLTKTYHLYLDAEGTVIVSQEIFDSLKQVGLGGMHLANEVLKPPHQTVGGPPARPERLPLFVKYNSIRRN